MNSRLLLGAVAGLISLGSAIANPLDELQAQAEALFSQNEFSPAPVNRSGFIALLLPLSGSFAATGEAVRDGFMAAAVASGVEVRVYDTGLEPVTTLVAYDQALREGAAALVGPLLRESIVALATQGVSLPWLALNYWDGAAAVPQSLQLGLAPEDEARSAAEQAYSQGLRRALTLTPSSDWGDRTQKAFAQRLQELGGQTLAAATYTAGAVNYSEPIRQLLALRQSEARHRALNDTLGMRTQFEPHRRNDADFIFLGARAQDGRLIWPQLRFYGASDLPVYATALIYEGRPDPELNGVRFCDMPFMLQAEGEWAALRTESQGLPSVRSQPRLFALGLDAFRVITRMQAGEVPTLNGNDSAVGRFLLSGNSVQRRMECAVFREGTPRLLVSADRP